MLLVGTYERQLDGNGRLALPADLRKNMADECYLVKGTERCVSVVPATDFERDVAEMREAVRRGERNRDEQRALAGSAQFVKLDKQGRLNLDEHLRVWAELATDSPVIVAGAFDCIEIWSPERHRRIDAAGSSALAGRE